MQDLSSRTFQKLAVAALSLAFFFISFSPAQAADVKDAQYTFSQVRPLSSLIITLRSRPFAVSKLAHTSFSFAHTLPKLVTSQSLATIPKITYSAPLAIQKINVPNLSLTLSSLNNIVLAVEVTYTKALNSIMLSPVSENNLTIAGATPREVGVAGTPLALPFVHTLTSYIVGTMHGDVFNKDTVTTYASRLNTHIPRLAQAELLPRIQNTQNQGVVLGAFTSQTPSGLAQQKKNLPFLDQLSLSFYCKLSSLSSSLDQKRCNYTILASGLLSSSANTTSTVTTTPVATVPTVGTPVTPSTSQAAKTSSVSSSVYLTKYITEYVPVVGPAGANGRDGRNGRDGQSTSNTPTSFGGFITPTTVNQSSTPYFAQSLIGVSTIGYLRDTTIEYANFNYGTSSNMYLANATLNGVAFSGSNVFTGSASFSAGVTANTLTASSSTFGNSTTTNAYATNLSAASSTFTDVSATRFLVDNATATNAFIQNLVVGSYITNGSSTSNGNVTVNGGLVVYGSSTLATTTVSSFTADVATTTNLIATNATTTNLIATNASTTNASSTNFFATNSITTNATSTNGFFSNLWSILARITDLVVGNSTTTNAIITNSTTTNAYVQNLVVGSSTSNGNVTVNGELSVVGTSTFATTTATSFTANNATSTNGFFSNLWSTLARITDLIVGNSTTTNAVMTNATSTNLFASNLFGMNATSTNFFSALAAIVGLEVTNSTTTNAIVTNSTTTNAYINNLVIGSGTLNVNGQVVVVGTSTLATTTATSFAATNASTTNLLAVNATSTNLVATNATLANASTTNAYIQNLVVGGGQVTINGELSVVGTSTFATTTATSFTANNATSTNGFFSNLWSTLARITDLIVGNSTTTNAVMTNATSTNLYTNTFVGGNATTTNLFSSDIKATNAYVSGGFGVGVATTAPGVIETSGNVYIGGSLNVAGSLTSSITNGQIQFLAVPFGTGINQGTLYVNPASAGTNNVLFGLSVAGTEKARIDAEGDVQIVGTFNSTNTTGTNIFSGNLTTNGNTILGDSTADTVTINGKITSTILPSTDLGSDLGSPTFRFGNIYAATTTISNLVAGGTASSTFIINTGNFTNDTQDSTLEFSRGVATPNAVLKWNSSLSQFEFNNFKVNFANSINVAGTASSSIAGMLTLTGTPLGTGLGQGSLYINPGSGSTNSTLFGVGVNGVERFRIDAEGDTTIQASLGIQNALFNINADTLTVDDKLQLNGNAIKDSTGTTRLTFGATNTFVGALDLGSSALTTGLINGQTISSAANFTGTLGVTGQTTLSTASSSALTANTLYATVANLTNASTTGLTATSLYTTNLLSTYSTSTNISSTNGSIASLITTSASTTNLSATGATLSSLFSSNATLTNASTTNLSATGATFGSTNTTGTATIVNASTTNLSASGFTTTNATLTNASTTNLSATGFTSASSTLVNATSSNFFATILNAITATFNSFTAGNITATSSLTSNGTLNVTGQTTLGNASTTGITATRIDTSIINASTSVLTNASTSNLSATGATFGNTNTTGTATILNASTTNLSASGLFATNAFLSALTVMDASTTNVSGSGLNFTNGFIGGLTTTNATITSASTTNLSAIGATLTNAFVGGLTTTNASTTNITASGDSYFSSLTSGSIPFISTGGKLSQNNANLFWDNANSRLGIGTATPASIVDIYGTDALRLPVGTTVQRPSLAGTGQVRYNVTTHQFEGYGDNAVWQGLGGVINPAQTTYITAGVDDYLRFVTSSVERMTIDASGNIGVGTTTPTSLFTVASSTATGTSNLFSVGTTSSILSVLANGNVGIGTANPGYALDLGASFGKKIALYNNAGAFYGFGLTAGGLFEFYANNATTPKMTIDQSSGATKISNGASTLVLNPSQGVAGEIPAGVIIGNDSTGNVTMFPSIGAPTTGSKAVIAYWNGTGRSALEIANVASGDGNLLLMKTGGNVGIGTTTPTAKFAVNGDSYFAGNVTATGTLNIAGSTTLASLTVNGQTTLVNASTTGLTATNLYATLFNTTGTTTLATAGGNVGIGTTSPLRALTVSKSASSDGVVYIQNTATDGYSAFSALDQTGTEKVGFGYANTNVGPTSLRGVGYFNTTGTVPLVFLTNGSSERMRISSTGNVGIGTTTPGSLFAVNGDSYFAGNVTATGTLNVTGQTTLGNASTTNLSATGATLSSLFSTNATLTNASTTNLSATGFSGVNGIFTGTFNVNGQTSLATASSTGLTVTGGAYLATAGGKVGIGTSTPGNALHVVSSVSGNTLQGRFENISSGQPAGFRLSNSTWDIGFRTIPNVAWFDIGDGSGVSQHQWAGKYQYIDPAGRIGFAAATLSSSSAPNYGNAYFNLGSANTIATPGNLTIAGNTGIGTSSPATKLDIVANNDQVSIRIGDNWGATTATQDGVISVRNFTTAEEDTSLLFVQSQDASNSNVKFGGGSPVLNAVTNVSFWTAANPNTLQGTQRMTIDSIGNVGIGTTTPAAMFAVNGNSYFAGNVTATGTLNVTGQMTLASASSTALTADTLYSTIANIANASTTNLTVASNAYFGGNTGIWNSSGYIGVGTTTTTAQIDSVNLTGNGVIAIRGYARAGGGNNIGVQGIGGRIGGNPSAQVGVFGRSTNGNGQGVGGFFSISTTEGDVTVPSYLTGRSINAALIADNMTSTAPIFVGLDNGSQVFQINDGGNVAIGTSTGSGRLSVQQAYGATTPLFDVATTTSAGFATSSLFSVLANGDVKIANGNKIILSNSAQYITSTGNYNFSLNTLYGTFLSNSNNQGAGLPLGSWTPEMQIGTGGNQGFWASVSDATSTQKSADATVRNIAINAANGNGYTGVKSRRQGGSVYLNGGLGYSASTGDEDGGDAGNIIAILKNGGAGFGSGVAGTDGAFRIQTGSNTNLLSVNYNGNVGIGTTTPAAKFAVNGDSYFAGNVTATGTITVPGALLTNATSANLNLSGWFRDSTNATGTSGQALVSTGTSTLWSTIVAGSGVSNAYASSTFMTLVTDFSTHNLTATGTLNVTGDTTLALASSTGLTATNLYATLFNTTGTTTLATTGGNVGIGTTSPATALDILGAPQTGSSAMGILNLTQTWNTTGTPTAFKLNVTDTASNASSLLADFQTGGVSVLAIQKGPSVQGRGIKLFGGARGELDITSGTGDAGDPIIAATGGSQHLTLNSGGSGFLRLNTNGNAIQTGDTIASTYGVKISGTTVTTMDLFSYNGANSIINGSGRPFDSAGTDIPANFIVTARDRPSNAANYIYGPSLSLFGGSGASATTTGAANGGNVYINGGIGYGTGHNGYILLGATTTSNVGIGTTSPVAMLSVMASSTSLTSPFISFNSTTSPIFNVLANGNVGIGSSTPGSLLTVGNTNQFSVTSAGVGAFTGAAKVVIDTNIGTDAGWPYAEIRTASGDNSSLSLKATGSTGTLYLSHGSAAAVQITGASSRLSFNNDAFLVRKGVANLQLGNTDTAAPVAQTLSVQSVSTGTTDTSAATTTFKASAGTGTGLGGAFVFQTATASSTSGTFQNAFNTAMTILGNGNVGIGTASPTNKLQINGDTSSQAVGPVVIKADGLTNTIGTAFTLNSTAVSGKIYSFIGTGSGATAGAGKFAIFNGSDSRYVFTVDANGQYISGVNQYTPVGQITSYPNSASTVGLAVVGASAQSANYFNVTSNGGTAGNMFTINSNGNVGIGTSTPYYSLAIQGVGGTNPFNIASSTGSSLMMMNQLGALLFGTTTYAGQAGEVYANLFTAASSTATSTFAGNVNIGSGGLFYNASTSVTSIANLELGNLSFDTDAGIVQWTDLPILNAATGTVQSYSAAIAGTSVLTVYGESNGYAAVQYPRVGINMATPLSVLDAYSATSTANVDIFRLLSDVGGASNVKFRIDSDGDVFTDGGTTIGTPADLAENYPALEAVDAGTVVAFGTSTVAWGQISNTSTTTEMYDIAGVRKALTDYEAIGVISTKAGITLGGDTRDGVPVAFSGRIPVKVTSENGEVHRGDFLTVSKTMPGYAMKMTGEGRALGRAISDFVQGKDRVMMLIENGNQKLDLAGRNASTTNMLTTGNVDLNANGVAIINIKSLASANGTWSIDENGRITAKTLCLEDVCIDKTTLTNILNAAGQSGVVNSQQSIVNGNTGTTGTVAGTSTTATPIDIATSTTDTSTTTPVVTVTDPVPVPANPAPTPVDPSPTPAPTDPAPVVDPNPVVVADPVPAPVVDPAPVVTP